MQKNLTRPFYMLLSLPATAMGFALSVQISALSWILTTQYGLDIHQVGLVWAAGPLAGIIGQVLVGLISDNVWFWHGRRRPFILIGGVLAGLMLLALPNIDIVSTKLGIDGLLGVAIAIALTLDLSINISFNPTRSIIADVTEPGDQRTRGYTWMQTVSGTFGVLAYAIGALWGNYALIYFGCGLVLLLSVVPPFFIEEPKELAQQGDNQVQKPVNLLTVLLNIKPLWGFIVYDIYALFIQLAGIKVSHYWVELAALAVTLLLVIHTLRLKADDTDSQGVGFQKILAAHSFSWVGVQTMFVYIIAFLQDKMPSFTDDQIGRTISISFLVLSAVSAILPALLLEPLAIKLGRVKVHVWCLASMALGYLAVALFGGNYLVLYVLMAILGIGWSSIISLPFAIMSDQVDAKRIGLYMGLFNLSVVIPQLLVSLAIGLFISQIDDKAIVFYISAGALAISAIAWCSVNEAKKNSV